MKLCVLTFLVFVFALSAFAQSQQDGDKLNMDFLQSALLILAAFGVVLLLSVYFKQRQEAASLEKLLRFAVLHRRRTEQHDNSFTSRTETPHVAPVPPGHTIYVREGHLRRPNAFYTPGPATTVVYDDDTVDALAMAATIAVMEGQTVQLDPQDQQIYQQPEFVPGGGDSGGGGASGSWDAPADDDTQQQQPEPDPQPDPEPEPDPDPEPDYGDNS